MPWLPTHADRRLGKMERRQIDDGKIGDAINWNVRKRGKSARWDQDMGSIEFES